MHSLRTAAFTPTLRLALVDARAANFGKRAQADGLSTSHTNKPRGGEVKARWTGPAKPAKVKRIFGFGEDGTHLNKDESKRKCTGMLPGLQKLKARGVKARGVKARAVPADHDWSAMGDESFTIPMDYGHYQGFDDEDDINIHGTEGINACAGFLVRRYFATRKNDNGEKGIIQDAATKLEIEVKDVYEYDFVGDGMFDNEDFLDLGKGAMSVNWEDGDPKATVWDEEKDSDRKGVHSMFEAPNVLAGKCVGRSAAVVLYLATKRVESEIIITNKHYCFFIKTGF
ncbi:MAG: hypothetical protein Q9213_002784 [Squamulea squamosa]